MSSRLYVFVAVALCLASLVSATTSPSPSPPAEGLEPKPMQCMRFKEPDFAEAEWDLIKKIDELRSSRFDGYLRSQFERFPKETMRHKFDEYRLTHGNCTELVTLTSGNGTITLGTNQVCLIIAESPNKHGNYTEEFAWTLRAVLPLNHTIFVEQVDKFQVKDIEPEYWTFTPIQYLCEAKSTKKT